MHQIALAKRPPPYYAWCSSGTSTQDVVDFDLQEETGSPRGGDAKPGRRPPGNTQRVVAKLVRHRALPQKGPVRAKSRCPHAQRQDFDRRPFHATHERFHRLDDTAPARSPRWRKRKRDDHGRPPLRAVQGDPPQRVEDDFEPSKITIAVARRSSRSTLPGARRAHARAGAHADRWHRRALVERKPETTPSTSGRSRTRASSGSCGSSERE